MYRAETKRGSFCLLMMRNKKTGFYPKRGGAFTLPGGMAARRRTSICSGITTGLLR